MGLEVYFRRPGDCVVYSPPTEPRDVSLVHRQSDGTWHCALCDSTGCRHARAAGDAARDRALRDAGAALT